MTPAVNMLGSSEMAIERSDFEASTAARFRSINCKARLWQAFCDALEAPTGITATTSATLKRAMFLSLSDAPPEWAAKKKGSSFQNLGAMPMISAPARGVALSQVLEINASLWRLSRATRRLEEGADRQAGGGGETGAGEAEGPGQRDESRPTGRGLRWLCCFFEAKKVPLSG